jgi:hypothetical protein
MANLGTLTAGIVASSFNISINGAEPVLEAIASSNDGSYLYANLNSTHTGFANLLYADMPTDFKHMETLSCRLRYLAAAAQTNTWNSLSVTVIAEDGTTILAGPTTIVAGPITATTGTNSSVVALTGVNTSASQTDWNDAVLRITWSVTRNKGGDSIQKRVTAAELTGTYRIDTSIDMSEAVTVTEDVTVRLAQLRVEAFDAVTLTEHTALVFSGEPALEISTSDLVIVQEGQESVPKFNVFDAVAVTDSVTVNLLLFPSVFDVILTQDSPAVSPTLISMAIVVFDNVLVREGVEDDLNVRPFVVDTITVDDTTVSIRFTRLNVTAFDAVTVVDAPSVFAQGPVGVIVFENVLVQEFIRLHVSVYINCFDAVFVSDGAWQPEVFDAVTVTEDITVKMARLVIDAFEAVTVTESVAGDGLTLELLNGVSIEDIIVGEDVVVLLTSLKVEASSDVFAADFFGTAVFVSSISLTVDVSEDVTVLDVVDTVQLNPILLDEFTEVTVTEDVQVLTSLLLIDVFDAVTVAEEVTMMLSLILLDVSDEVSVTERVAMRITSASAGGTAQKSDLPTLGAGR